MRIPHHFTILLFIALLIMPACFLLSCKRGPSEFMYVANKGGADFYASAEDKEPMARIDCAEKLGVLSRKTEKGASWVEIQWKERKGWIKESDLAAADTAELCSQAEVTGKRITPGPVIPGVKAVDSAKKLYRDHFKKCFDDIARRVDDSISDDMKLAPKIDSFLDKIISSVKVKAEMGDFIVLSHNAPLSYHGVDELIENEFSTFDALWQRWEDGWRLIAMCERSGCENRLSRDIYCNQIYLSHLNHDEFPDVLVITYHPDSEAGASVFMSRKDKSMVIAQEMVDFASSGNISINTGRCGETSIITEGYEGKVNMTFDCTSNKLVRRK